MMFIRAQQTTTAIIIEVIRRHGLLKLRHVEEVSREVARVRFSSI